MPSELVTPILICVCGGRTFSNRPMVFGALDRLDAEGPIVGLWHGACGWDADDDGRVPLTLRGADALADRWAYFHDVPVFRYPARWRALGPKAGPIRIRQMLEDMQRTASKASWGCQLLAFPGGAGTLRTLEIARDLAIQVTLPRPKGEQGGT